MPVSERLQFKVKPKSVKTNAEKENREKCTLKSIFKESKMYVSSWGINKN